jgi:hypothetical protein
VVDRRITRIRPRCTWLEATGSLAQNAITLTLRTLCDACLFVYRWDGKEDRVQFLDHHHRREFEQLLGVIARTIKQATL